MKFGLRLLTLLSIFAGLVVSAHAEWGRWRLGSPPLLLEVPNPPTAGGVKWHQPGPYGLLVSSWSAHSEEVLVEVAERYGSATLQEEAEKLAKALGANVSSSRAGSVSACPTLYFTIGGGSGLVLSDQGRIWTVLVTPKSSSAHSAIAKVLTSITVERNRSQRWVRRSVGKTKMNALLPFELAPDLSNPEFERRKAYELHFDGLQVTAFSESPGEGMRFDYGKIVSDYIEGEKKVAGTENFKSKRTRVKGIGFTGDEIELEFSRGTKHAFIRSLFIGDDKGVSRLSVLGDPRVAAHKSYCDKIHAGLAVSDVSFDGMEPRQAGNEGIWVDFPLALEKSTAGGSSFRQYGAFAGGSGIDVRIVDKDAGSPDNPAQILDFMEAKFRGNAKGAKDVAFERSETLVSGLVAHTLKMTYVSKGSKVVQCGSAIFGPDRNYVIELIGYESQRELLERVLDTARVEIPIPVGWSMQVLGEAGVALLCPKSVNALREPLAENGSESLLTAFVNEDGLFCSVVEIRYSADPPNPATELPKLAKTITKSLGVTYRTVEQRPIDIGTSTGIRASMMLILQGNEIPAEMVIVRKGKYLWAMLLTSNPKIRESVLKHYAILNSLR